MRTTGSRVALGGVAAAVPAWWFGLFTSETFRSLFVPGTEWTHLRAFLPADLALTVLTALAAVRLPKYASPAALGGAACGAWGYATAWTCVATWNSALRPASAVAMLAGCCTVGLACYALVPSRHSH